MQKIRTDAGLGRSPRRNRPRDARSPVIRGDSKNNHGASVTHQMATQSRTSSGHPPRVTREKDRRTSAPGVCPSQASAPTSQP